MYNSTASDFENKALMHDLKAMEDMDGLRYEELQTEIMVIKECGLTTTKKPIVQKQKEDASKPSPWASSPERAKQPSPGRLKQSNISTGRFT